MGSPQFGSQLSSSLLAFSLAIVATVCSVLAFSLAVISTGCEKHTPRRPQCMEDAETVCAILKGSRAPRAQSDCVVRESYRRCVRENP